MITGIIEDIGTVLEAQIKHNVMQLQIKTQLSLNEMRLGDSIAVNGVCLTLVQIDGQIFQVEVVKETLLKTNLKYLIKGSQVNLERMAKFGDRINGHIVQGHVDACSEVISTHNESGAKWLEVALPNDFAQYFVKKGSICLDGMSLTIVNVTKDRFSITLIPHTLKKTIAKSYQAGQKINLEVDILAKHVEKLLEHHYER